MVSIFVLLQTLSLWFIEPEISHQMSAIVILIIETSRQLLLEPLAILCKITIMQQYSNNYYKCPTTEGDI